MVYEQTGISEAQINESIALYNLGIDEQKLKRDIKPLVEANEARYGELE